MPRLVVPAQAHGSEPSPFFLLEGPVFRHARKVLRLAEGDSLEIVDGTGAEYACRVESITGRSMRATVIERRERPPEPAVRVWLYCGLLKGEKLDFVLQKATEVGVAEIVFFVGERSVVRLEADGRGGKRGERWRRIVEGAVAQCGRAALPGVTGPIGFAEAVRGAATADVAVMLWEGERTRRLRDVLRERAEARSVAVVVGPEGGFSAEEAAVARGAGVEPVSLGSRILRAETAAIVGPALVLGHFGDLG